MYSMTTFEKLTVKVKQHLGIDIENVRRVHSGRNMKASGANSWTSNQVGSLMEIGSCHTATDILKAKKLKLVPGWTSGQQDIEISN